MTDGTFFILVHLHHNWMSHLKVSVQHYLLTLATGDRRNCFPKINISNHQKEGLMIFPSLFLYIKHIRLVQSVQWLCYGGDNWWLVGCFLAGAWGLSPPKHPKQLFNLPCHLFNGYWRVISFEVKWPGHEADHSAPLVLRLKGSAAAAPLLHTPPWLTQGVF
jgi:hypothetical protein